MKRCLSVPSHYQNWLQIIDIHPRAISQNISKIWWQLLASPVLLGSQWVNPCLPSPMHDWAAEAAKHDPASSLKTASHQTALRNIMFRSREWSTCHSLLSPRWVNTSSSCWRQTRTPPSRTPALLGLGWIPLDLGAFNLGLIAPVTALTLGYRSAWSPGTALSHLGSASLVAQGLYSDIGLKT